MAGRQKSVEIQKKVSQETVFISDSDQYLFGQGTHYEIYKKLGSHPSVEGKDNGYFFGVWAPNAEKVFVIGEFNKWNEKANPMVKIGKGGIWSTFIAKVKKNQLYKYLIITAEGEKLYKADPYANYAELRPGTASKTTNLAGFKWTDEKWMTNREHADMEKEPIAIYECHIGSWMRHPQKSEKGFYSYREFADKASVYVKEMGYTHVELMGVAEYPYDGSWGYQVTGYYAPTARYGDPQEFMYLINKFHALGIGVILDWVPAHFATDAHGLAEFDGGCIYEDADPRRGEHPDWGTKIFNFGKKEVSNFLIANAFFWLREFHIDGIRVDAVASMLYLDYGKQEGQWLPNIYGENKNLEAIEFFRHLNSVIRGSYPGFMTIAEESTAWPDVTGPIGGKGLGFLFKWNMGWMHDFCEYMKLDPYFRRNSHNTLTFAMTYNASENYILPLSHDEVVHLKCSMLNKMPGYMVDKFANLRNGYTFMMGHSGKKLLFMGQEFAQEREWGEERELDWFLLQEPLHKGMQDYVKELLQIYHKYPCLWENDNSWDGFEWMNANDSDRSIYSFIRKSQKDKKRLLFIINMTPVKWDNYRVALPTKGKYKLILSGTEKCFGGNGDIVPAFLEAEKIKCALQEYSATFDVPAYGALIYAF